MYFVRADGHKSVCFNFFFSESETTEHGWECVTPCGQEDLYNGKNWCHISEDTDDWIYCDPQLNGECFSKTLSRI